MDQLIRGMSTAFLTSIVGVCGSLLFNLLNNRATDKCQKAIDRFCEVFSLYAMPKPVSEDTAMLALQQGADGLHPPGGGGYEPEDGRADGAEHHARHAAGAALDG